MIGAAEEDVPNRITKKFTGSCVCGAIAFSAEAPRPLWYCHCRQCRNMTGHFMAATQVDLDKLEVKGEPKWYYVSDTSRHGFCAECGSQLFWRNDKNPYLSITGGSLDDASELEVAGHIYTAEKGCYYEIPSDVEQHQMWNDPNPGNPSSRTAHDS